MLYDAVLDHVEWRCPSRHCARRGGEEVWISSGTKLKRPPSGGFGILGGGGQNVAEKGEFGEREEGRSQPVDFDESQRA